MGYCFVRKPKESFRALYFLLYYIHTILHPYKHTTEYLTIIILLWLVADITRALIDLSGHYAADYGLCKSGRNNRPRRLRKFERIQTHTQRPRGCPRATPACLKGNRKDVLLRRL